jgi:hypothetical protein
MTPLYIRILGTPADPSPYGTPAGLLGWIKQAPLPADKTVTAYVPTSRSSVGADYYSLPNQSGSWEYVEPTAELEQQFQQWQAHREAASPALTSFLSSLTPDPVAAAAQRAEFLSIESDINPCGVERNYGINDKNYTCLNDFEDKGLGQRQRTLAIQHTLTPEEGNELARLTAICHTVTMWPNHQSVRDVTQEFDLDPYVSQFSNLYEHLETTKVTPQDLRSAVIHYLNRGFTILDFTALSNPNTCSSSPEDIRFISVEAGKRRPLPEKPFTPVI